MATSGLVERKQRQVKLNNKSLWRRIRNSLWSYIFLTPMLVLMSVFVIYPIFGSVRYALYNWDGVGEPTQFVGLRHFATVATDPYFWSAFGHTFLYGLVLVPVQLTLSLILAIVLNNPRLRFAKFYRTIYFLPVVTSVAVIGVVMSLLFANISSNLPQWIVDLGWIKPALGITNDPDLVMPAIIGIGIWQTLGTNMVFFLAALQSVPKDLYEAATVDGAGKLVKFWRITIPMISSIGIIIVFQAFLFSLQVFDLVWVLTQGGPFYASEVVSTYIYGFAFTSSHGSGKANYGYASAAGFFMSVILVVLALVMFATLSWLRRKQPGSKD